MRTISIGAALALACLAGLAGPAAAQDPGRSQSMRIYDLRDLASLVGSPDAGAAATQPPNFFTSLPPGAAMGGARPPGGGRGGSSPSIWRGVDAPPAPVEILMTRLCAANDLALEPLLPGVVIVTGPNGGHDALALQLEELRAIYRDRYELHLMCYSVPRDTAVKAGDRAEAGDVLVSIRQILPRREPSLVQAVTTHRYVSDLQPVVGDAAMGYDPKTATVDEGLSVTVTIGAGEDSRSSVPIHVRGELTTVSLGRQVVLTGRPDAPPMALDLPAVHRRAIRADLDVPFGTLTVLSALEGLRDGETVVVAAAVRQMGRPGE